MQENKEAERNRITYLIWIIVTMILGLSSRKFGPYLPVFVRDYAGDTLWALMVFWGIGILFVKMSTGKVMAAALLFSYAIEFSQLYQAEWINALRHTTLGGLVLGFGFLWSDLVCYTVGVLAGGLMEYTAAPFFFRSIVCLRRGKGRRE